MSESLAFPQREERKDNGPFKCLYCGRFAKFIAERLFYDGSGTQCEWFWSCSLCGDRRDDIW